MTQHQPVLLRECLELFEKSHLKTFVDGTLGAGGHAKALLESHPEIELYIGFDQDQSALAIAGEVLKPWAHKLKLIHSNYADFAKYVDVQVDGILLDLGVSSMQIDQPGRGFSFRESGPLDMRMDQTKPLTAATIVNEWSEKELMRILWDYGELKSGRYIARLIVEHRPFHTTKELVDALEPKLMRDKKPGLHPLTLVFQALRIAVNKELEVLEKVMPVAIERLAKGGVIGVISFHSLEDRIVKSSLRFAASDKYDTSGIGGVFRDKEPIVELLTKKPMIADAEEVAENPRSRSAKLRGALKL